MKRIRIVIGMLVMAVLLGICAPTEMKAADSYTDPQTFFNSCEYKNHAEFTDNYIYFCTKGKTAASTSQMRFYTLGFQITATGNGSSMYIDVKRGGNYLVEVKELAYDDGFTYTLYKISYDDICKVMGNKNSTTWNNINKASAVTFQMDAIMTYKPSGSDTPACEITAESTTGKITPSTSKLWYTNNSEDLSELEDMFSVGRFEHYKGIKQTLRNNTLTVNFYAKYTDVTATGYKIDPVTSKITTLTGGVFQRTGNHFRHIVFVIRLLLDASKKEFHMKPLSHTLDIARKK